MHKNAYLHFLLSKDTYISVLFLCNYTCIYILVAIEKMSILIIIWNLYTVYEYFLIEFFCKDFIYLFLESGERRKKGEKKYQYAIASCMPLTGAWPATQVCALTRIWTGDPFVHRLALNPRSHTSQGYLIKFFKETVMYFVLIYLEKIIWFLLSSKKSE